MEPKRRLKRDWRHPSSLCDWGAQCWGHAEYVFRPLFIIRSQSYFSVLAKPGSSWRSSSRSAVFKTAHGCQVSIFFHLLMCSFLILAHPNKQRGDWPVSVSVQQFPSALFFTILNHSWLDQVGRMTEKKTKKKKPFTITVCAFQRANIPHWIPKEIKVV